MQEDIDDIDEHIKKLNVYQFVKDQEAVDEITEKLRECIRLNITQNSALNFTGLYCPLVFDGWMCWNATPAGTIAVNQCPNFITGFDPHRTAFRECDESGTWFIHPMSNLSWSNYSTCIDFEDFEWRKTINLVYMSGYSISLIALLLSIFILVYFRALHCTRNILHINLFSSFSVNNLLWLIWYITVVPVPDVVAANGIGCQALFVGTHYFMLTNYFWMLCEGFYLHSLLAFAFIIEEQLLKYVYIIGWVIPIFIIVSYTILRIIEEDNNDCWIHESYYSHVLIIPVVISMCINLIFLISILRVLLLKIKTNTNQGQNRNELIKVFRAAFVLVPLLGIHYMIILIRPQNDLAWERGHEILSAVSASYQGLCVACLFCFFNNEVHVQLKRKWNQYRNIQTNHLVSTATGSTYAYERRATRSSAGTLTHQTNELSSPIVSHYISGNKSGIFRKFRSIVSGYENETNCAEKTLTLTTEINESKQSLKQLTRVNNKINLIHNNSQVAEDYV